MIKTLQQRKLQGAENEASPPWCLIGPGSVDTPTVGLSAVSATLQSAVTLELGTGL